MHNAIIPIAILALGVAIGYTIGLTKAESFKTQMKLHSINHLNIALSAAEKIPPNDNMHARQALETIAALELTLAHQYNPGLEDMDGRQIDGICKALDYFDPDHPAAFTRAARDYLDFIEPSLRAYILSNEFSPILFRDCIEVLNIKMPTPCALKDGCPPSVNNDT